MVAIEGKELTNPHGGYHEHDVSFFNSLGKTDQHKDGYNRKERLEKVSRRMGLLSLAHPRGNVTAGELAGQVKRFSAGVLMEVFTRGSSTDARKLWDAVLKQTKPFGSIWSPVITRIEVIGQKIRISGENINGINWISEGERIADEDTLDLGVVDVGNYVRAELMCENGEISCTQPFGIVHHQN